MKLSVIIPAYNEEERLPKTLQEIAEYLSQQSYDSEIIVVSDGSKDRTGEVVREMIPEIRNLRLIENKENHGKGYAVRQGVLEGKGAYRIFTDADNSTSIDQIEKMWPWFEQGYDVVIGSRDIKGAVLDPPQPWWRRVLLGKSFRFLTHLICGTWNILDSQCGFKMFTRKAAEDIFPRIRILGFSFDVEVLVIAKRLGYRVKEIPVHWKNDPKTKVKLSNTFKMGIDLLKIRWNLLRGKYGS